MHIAAGGRRCQGKIQRACQSPSRLAHVKRRFSTKIYRPSNFVKFAKKVVCCIQKSLQPPRQSYTGSGGHSPTQPRFPKGKCSIFYAESAVRGPRRDGIRLFPQNAAFAEEAWPLASRLFTVKSRQMRRFAAQNFHRQIANGARTSASARPPNLGRVPRVSQFVGDRDQCKSLDVYHVPQAVPHAVHHAMDSAPLSERKAPFFRLYMPRLPI